MVFSGLSYNLPGYNKTYKTIAMNTLFDFESGQHNQSFRKPSH
jgi:hypothetical protein